MDEENDPNRRYARILEDAPCEGGVSPAVDELLGTVLRNTPMIVTIDEDAKKEDDPAAAAVVGGLRHRRNLVWK